MNNMKKIISGVILGILFIIGSIVLIWYNETNNVENSNMIMEAKQNVIDINSSPIDPQNEGKLVSFTGNVTVETENTLDDIFKIGTKTAKLRRTVEMYQWVREETGKVNGEPIYEYKKMWSEDLYSSVGYTKGHENPETSEYESKIFTAQNVKVGAFLLNQELVEKMSTKENYDIPDNILLPIGYNLIDNYITNATVIEEPKIGNIRISYQYNASTEVSLIAKQIGSTFDKYTFSTGKTIIKIEDGKLTGNQLIKKTEDYNSSLKWILRVVGIALCIIGFAIMFNPISKSTSFIPVIGSIAGFAAGFIGLFLGTALSFITIAVVWLNYNKILSISLIGVGILLFIIVLTLGRKNKKNIEKGVINPEEEIRKVAPEQKEKEEKVKALIDVNDHYVKIVNGVEIKENNQDLNTTTPISEEIKNYNSLDSFIAPVLSNELNAESIIKVDPIKENPALQSIESNLTQEIEQPKENPFAKALGNIPEDELLKSKEFDSNEQYKFEIPDPVNVEDKIPTKFEQPKINIEPTETFTKPVINNVEEAPSFTAPIINEPTKVQSFTAPVVNTEPLPSFTAPIINETQNQLVQEQVNEIITMQTNKVEQPVPTAPVQSTPNDFITTIEITTNVQPTVYKPIDIDSMIDNNQGLIPTIVESDKKEN